MSERPPETTTMDQDLDAVREALDDLRREIRGRFTREPGVVEADADEGPAWFRLLGELRHAGLKYLKSGSQGQVGFLELNNQPIRDSTPTDLLKLNNQPIDDSTAQQTFCYQQLNRF